MRRSLALFVLAALFVLGVAPPGTPAASEDAPAPRPAAARGGAADSASGLAAPDSFAFDSTAGDSFAAPRLYLSWVAPAGLPGARSNLDFTCRDTNEVDTLFLSFETGRDLPRFTRMYGRLFFRPVQEDTLGAFWDYTHEGANRGHLIIQFDPDESFPCAQPWLRHGRGGVSYRLEPQLGWLELAFAVRPGDAAPISGRTRYCFARVIFDQRWCHLSGVRQPVCIEWEEARYSGGGRLFSMTGGPERFVAANSAGGKVCAARRRSQKPKVWAQPAGKPIAPVRRPQPDSTGR